MSEAKFTTHTGLTLDKAEFKDVYVGGGGRLVIDCAEIRLTHSGSETPHLPLMFNGFQLRQDKRMKQKNSTQTIDFSEIESHTKFEQFTADLLESLGYEILSRPGEGNDGGKDLIVVDILEGIHGRQSVKYLVSCKHQLSGAVGLGDEKDIEDRVKSNHCDAFMGVYANHVTQGLINKAEGLKSAKRGPENFDIVFIQDADIRKHLLELPNGLRLVKQWFPRGHAAYIHTISESLVYKKRPEMWCTTCKADLLQDFTGVVIYEASHGPPKVPTTNPERDERNRYHILDIKPYCREHIPPPSRKPYNDAAMTFDLSELINPNKYIKRVYEDVKFMYAWPPYFVDIDVFRKWNHLIHILYYFVARAQHSPPPPPSTLYLLPSFRVDEWKL